MAIAIEPIAMEPIAAEGAAVIITGPSTVAIIIEDGTCVAGANSLVSAAEADIYFSNKINTGIWFGLTASQKDLFCITGSQFFSIITRWCGQSLCALHTLGWPRSGATDPQGMAVAENVVPEFVKSAIFELIFIAFTENLWAIETEGEARKYDRVKMGPLEVEYRKGSTSTIISKIPSWWWAMISPCGRPASGLFGRVARAGLAGRG